MPDAATVAADKARQVNEARERGSAVDPNLPPVDADLNAGAMDVAGDLDPVDHAAAVEGNEPSERAPPERVLSAREQMQQDIVNRFRSRRTDATSDEAENAREIRAMTHDGMPPELVEAIGPDVEDEPLTDAEIAAAPRQQEPPAPVIDEQKKHKLVFRGKERFVTDDELLALAQRSAAGEHKLIVRGQERLVTDDELIALAQKSAAGDDYLGEARQKLDEISRMQQDLATRAAQPSKHPAGEGTETGDQPTADEHPVNPYKEVTETLLYGDPDKAAEQLEKLLNSRIPAIAKNVSDHDRRRAEHARSERALSDFRDANPDLTSYSATGAIEGAMMHHLFQDLVATGMFNLAKLKEATPNIISNLHLSVRSDPVHSGKVRSPDKLLEAAKADFLNEVKSRQTLMETKQADSSAQPAARQAAPRVDVQVDRTARRNAIPQQPARTTPLRPVAQQQQPPRTRSDIIAEQAKARGKVVSA